MLNKSHINLQENTLQFTHLNFPINIISRRNRMHDSANESTDKDFFMRLLSVITLYLFIISFINILFDIINGYFPLPQDTDSYSLRWEIAYALVSFPVYLYTSFWLNKECKQHPEKIQLKSKKSFTNFTLFLIALIIMSDLGSLIFHLLGDELSPRFLLKVLILFLVTGITFYYYYYDLTQARTVAEEKRWFFSVVTIVVLVLAYSIYKVESSAKTHYNGSFLPASAPNHVNTHPIPYCASNTKLAIEENVVLQTTVRQFSAQTGCQIGDSCLTSWQDKDATKFSITWSSVCSFPGIGDGGKSSTFQCERTKNNQVCCWPLGFTAPKACAPLQKL